MVSHARVLKLLKTFHDEFCCLMKPYKGQKDDHKYLEKLKQYDIKCKEKLFDITACKCIYINYKCLKTSKETKIRTRVPTR